MNRSRNESPAPGGGSSRRSAEPAASTVPPWLIGILALALAVRLLYFFQLSATPFGDTLFLDARIYDDWAARIAAGDWSGGARTFFLEPGYAYLLAVGKLLGAGPRAVRLMQAALGTATVGLTALMARRISGPKAAIAAGLLAALYLPLVYFEGLVLKTTLEIFLLVLLLYLLILVLDRPRPGPAAAAGAAAGAAILVRSNLLLVAILGAAFVLASARRRTPRAWLPAALVLAGPAVALGAVAIRNGIVAGQMAPVPYNSGINFYIGNCGACNGVDPGYPFGRGLPEYEEEDSRIEAQRRAGRALSDAGTSSQWWAEAWREIGAAPARWIELLGVKLLLFWNAYEITDNESIYFVRRWVPVLRWPLPGFWIAAPLGLAGLGAVLAGSGGAARRLVAACMLAQMGVVVMFHVADRYRLPAVPLMLALGAAGVADAIGSRGRRGWVAGGAALGAGLGAALVALPNPVSPAGQNLTNHYAMIASAALAAGEGDAALEDLRRAAKEDPNSADAHYNLAAALETVAQDHAGAELELHEALRLKPDMADAWSDLGRVLDKLGRPEEAADAFLKAAGRGYRKPESLISAAAMYGRARRYDDAMPLLNEALRLKPDDPQGLETLGGIRYQKGDAAGALEAWERSLELRPDNPRLREFVTKLRPAPSK